MFQHRCFIIQVSLVMILLNANAGSMTPDTLIKLLNRLLRIESEYEHPQIMHIQETVCKDPNHFGFPKVFTSEGNEDNFRQINASEPETVIGSSQRISSSYGPENLLFPPELNYLSEVTVGIGDIHTSTKKKCLKTAFINMYRNHIVAKQMFKAQMDKLIMECFLRSDIDAVIATGDVNDPNLKIDNLFEIPHNGKHKHNKTTKETLIDKIFVCSKIKKLHLRVLVMPSIENNVHNDDNLGHKVLTVFIEEPELTEEKIKITSNSKFISSIKSEFTPEKTADLISLIKNKRVKDPSRYFINKISNAVKNATIVTKKKDPKDFQHFKTLAYESSPEALKDFCAYYKRLKNSILLKNPKVSLEMTEDKPPVKDLCSYLENKINKIYPAKQETIDDFCIEMLKKDFTTETPRLFSADDLDTAFKNIKNSGATWFYGISPNTMKIAHKASPLFNKALLTLINESMRRGIVFETMCWDRVFFIHKKGKENECKNYRPIMIDCPITKITCQLIKDQMFHKMFKYVYEFNYSYVKNKSTASAIIHIAIELDKIVIDGDLPVMIATDCSAAFETIQSNLVLQLFDQKFKDSECKIKDWVEGYLKNKIINGIDENGSKIPLTRSKVEVGSGQGSKVSGNFWLFQASCAAFWINQLKDEFMAKHPEVLLTLLHIFFADDNVSITRLKKFANDLVNTNNCSAVVDTFLEMWEQVLVDCGMIMNETKTEILRPDKKLTIKYLGTFLKMNPKGQLTVDIHETIQNLRKKTWTWFVEMQSFIHDVIVNLRIYNIFVEPIIYYSLIGPLISPLQDQKKAISELQIFQNKFVRRISKLPKSAKLTVMYEKLGIKMIQPKLGRLACTEWNKINGTKDYTPTYRMTRSGKVLVIKTVLDRIYQLKIQHEKIVNPNRKRANEILKKSRKRISNKELKQWRRNLRNRNLRHIMRNKTSTTSTSTQATTVNTTQSTAPNSQELQNEILRIQNEYLSNISFSH